MCKLCVHCWQFFLADQMLEASSMLTADSKQLLEHQGEGHCTRGYLMTE